MHAAPSSGPVVINLNAKLNIFFDAVQQDLAAGTWTVTPIGVADGGQYNAYQPGGIPGWSNVYGFASPPCANPPGVECPPFDIVPITNIGDGNTRYATDLEALQNATPSSFTLAANATVAFWLNDCPGCLGDNVGGMSLRLAQQPSNRPPIANAGEDQTVESGVIVTLHGGGSSDPDGDPLTYNWTQLSGPTVTLQDSNSVNAKFFALSANATIELQLTVSDGAVTSTDTVSVFVKRRPLVVIPGILGTSLWGPDDLVWLDLVAARKPGPDLFLFDLELDDAGESVQPIGASEIFDGSAPQFLNVYGDLLSFLQGRGFVRNQDLFTFPYDWRLSNEENALRLRNFINQRVPGGTSVDVIAHSMGGLLTRRYAGLDGSRLGRIIYVGTPHLGSVKAFNGLAFPDVLTNNFLRIPLSGLNRNTLAQVAQTFPSVFQLLPRFEFLSLDAETFLDLSATYTPAFLRSVRWVADANVFHNAISSSVGVPQFNIVGSGIPTLGGLIRSGVTHWIPVGSGGDATVPVESALGVPGAARTIYVNKVEHSDLPNDACVHMVIQGILDSGLAELPPCEAADSPFPNSVSLDWETGSPVRVTIVDSIGRANGVGVDDSVLQEIPLSSFFVFEGSEGGFLLAGQEYRVRVVATDVGVFSLRFTERDSTGAALRAMSWTNVPVAPTSRAELTLFADGSTSALALDVDGDGSVDIGLQANQPTPPAVSLGLLKRILANLEIQEGIKRSLLAKAESAERAIDRGNLKAAANMLTALSNEVSAQFGKHIRESDAKGLISIVTLLVEHL